MTTATISPGFRDVVGDSQRNFDAIMRALSQPGVAFPLSGPVSPPDPLTGEMAAVLLTLADHDTTVWLSPSLAKVPAIARFIAFHCGARLTDDPAQATFAFAPDWAELPPFNAFAQGTAEYPDRSTTLVVASRADSHSKAATLSGPGIKGHRQVDKLAVSVGRLAEWAENHRRFPLGVDLLITIDGQVMGFPRSTAIEGRR